MHSLVVQFLSVVFACFNVLSIIVQWCLKSLKVKIVRRKSFSNSRGSGNAIHIQFNKLKELRKKIGVIKEKNLHKFVLRSGNGIHIQFNKLKELRKKNWGY